MRQTRSKFLRLPGCAFTLLTGITQRLKTSCYLTQPELTFVKASLCMHNVWSLQAVCDHLCSCIYLFGGEVGGRSLLISLGEGCNFFTSST